MMLPNVHTVLTFSEGHFASDFVSLKCSSDLSVPCPSPPSLALPPLPFPSLPSLPLHVQSSERASVKVRGVLAGRAGAQARLPVGGVEWRIIRTPFPTSIHGKVSFIFRYCHDHELPSSTLEKSWKISRHPKPHLSDVHWRPSLLPPAETCHPIYPMPLVVSPSRLAGDEEKHTII